MEMKSVDLSHIEITSAQVSLILKATNEIKSKFGDKEIRALRGKELEYAKSILRGVNDKLQKTGIKVVDIKKRGVEKGAKVKLHDGKEYILKGLNEYFHDQKAQSPIYNCLYDQHEEKMIVQANHSYLREYVSLKLSNLTHNRMSPNVKLGKIIINNENKSYYQYVLFSEILGQDNGDKFYTLDEYNIEERQKELGKISKQMWQDAFAISVELFNDYDAGKPDNMEILINVIQSTIKVCLLDLAYQSFDKVGLDTKTLLHEPLIKEFDSFSPPKNANVSPISGLGKGLESKFRLNENFKNRLDSSDRAKALKWLVDQKGVIMKHLDDIAQAFSKNIEAINEAIKIVEEMRGEIINRISYLEKILNEYAKIQQENKNVLKAA